MGQRITCKVGDVVSYMGRLYEVVEVYSHIAYLKKMDKTGEKVCVGVGDLVMSGACLADGTPIIS